MLPTSIPASVISDHTGSNSSSGVPLDLSMRGRIESTKELHTSPGRTAPEHGLRQPSPIFTRRSSVHMQGDSSDEADSVHRGNPSPTFYDASDEDSLPSSPEPRVQTRSRAATMEGRPMTEAQRAWIGTLAQRTAHWTPQEVHHFLQTVPSPLLQLSYREVLTYRDSVRKQPALYAAHLPIPHLTEQKFAAWEALRNIQGQAMFSGHAGADALATPSTRQANESEPPPAARAPLIMRLKLGGVHVLPSPYARTASTEPQALGRHESLKPGRGRQAQFPISREILNGLLNRRLNAPIDSASGPVPSRLTSQVSVKHFAALLREHGIPMGMFCNKTLYNYIYAYDPAHRNYSMQRIEPSLEGPSLRNLIDTSQESEGLSVLFESLTRGGQTCTLERFLSAVLQERPDIPPEVASQWYFEEIRPGQVIAWRTEGTLRQTSRRVAPSSSPNTMVTER